MSDHLPNCGESVRLSEVIHDSDNTFLRIDCSATHHIKSLMRSNSQKHPPLLKGKSYGLTTSNILDIINQPSIPINDETAVAWTKKSGSPRNLMSPLTTPLHKRGYEKVNGAFPPPDCDKEVPLPLTSQPLGVQQQIADSRALEATGKEGLRGATELEGKP